MSWFANLGGVFFFLLVFGYVPAQAYAVVTSSGRWRVMAWAPVAVMLPIGVFTLRGYEAHENLWPVPWLVVGPLMTLYLGAVVLKRPKRRMDSVP